MFDKVLIADRGEIAVRIIYSLREMGIKTVVVYSQADRDSLPVILADEAVCIGPADIKQSYLNFASILSAAHITGSQAIHPGYGPLSENLEFVEACVDGGITFIGSSVDSMSLMADKLAAKHAAKSCGIPVVPGSRHVIEGDREALEVADELGFPVIIKAVGGGGGRGIKVVADRVDFLDTFYLAKQETKEYLKKPGIYVEKYLENARHIEFQILCDHRQHAIHLGDRDCTIQRRYQKIIEESPAAGIDDDLRRNMGQAAVDFVKSVGYSGIGTVEYLLMPDGSFYFSEMNTRIQVEHTVTEMVTGLDVVKQQLVIAAGDELEYDQDDIVVRGHGIECRIMAEDPFRFTPSTGWVTEYISPGGPGVRVDSAVFCGAFVNPFYDSLIAKLIVAAPDRPKAIERMKRALSSFIIDGIETSIPMCMRIMNDPQFSKGYVNGSFINQYI
ncbi:MAG: acetyl-CoA carboxylase biotin carboxylase subunit [Deltaproteobacteria bacterium]|nr:acetyl-CoA carboxylase biotin carboxylase subunit [Candidatus Zymogenaceae bacterium]